MARYLVLWKANASVWPTDPKQVLAVLEGAAAGGDMMLQSGGAEEIGWLTAESGYAIAEANSKAEVLGRVSPFFPMYSQEIHEIVPWDAAKESLLASARMMASR